MKNKYLLALFCSTFFLGISVRAGAQDTLTVMSYNIYHGEAPEAAGKSTLRQIGQFIRRRQPDFVALQEIDSATTRLANVNDGRSFGLADSLAKLTGMQAYFGQTIDFQGGSYGIALLSKDLVKVRKVRLPNPQNGEPRVLLIAQAQTRSNRPFMVAGTHLDHKYQENRLSQVRTINEELVRVQGPVILAGDFNFSPGSEGYAAMRDHWLDAGLQVVGKDSPALTYPSDHPQKRIDYIWLSKQASWKVLQYTMPDVRFSDHRPVVAKVVVYP